MDEHKKYERRTSAPGSLDGMVSDGRQLGVPAHRAYQPNKQGDGPSLDNFIRREDGFQPIRQSELALGKEPKETRSSALMDEPIVLDDIKRDKKKRRLQRKSGRSKKFLKRAALTMMALVLIGGGYFGIKLYLTQKNLFRGGGKSPALSKCRELSQLKREGDCRVNILLLGIGGENHPGGNLTDTMMIASIDPINNKTVLLSVPRDLWVRIPGNGSQKINAAFAYGKERSRAKAKTDQQRDGIELVDKTLEPILGIPIHYNMVMNFSAFEDVVNALGGVTLNVPKELAVTERLWIEGTNRNYNLNVKEGVQRFDGTKALYYARSRYSSKRGDFDRSERQRLLMTGIKDKVFSAGTFSNPVKISQLLSSLGNNIYTDFSLDDMKNLYDALKKIPSKDITSTDLATPPNDLVVTGNINGLSVVQPKAGLYDYAAIQSYIRNTLKDAQLAKENSSIAVYNATNTAGLAAKGANDLKSYGYNITTVANATVTNPANTIVVDLTKGTHKYTKNYLEGRFGVTARSAVPPGSGITPPAGTNFVIILGDDAATTRQN